MAKTLILNQADLRDCVGLDTDSLEVVENAFRLLATAAVAMPPILRLDVPEHNGEVDVKTAYLPGVALAIKAASPAIRTHGISMQLGAAMHASLEAGEPVEVEELPTLADSLGGGIGLDNRFTYSITRELCDEVHLLDEASIARGIRHAYREERLVVEGAAAVGIAALLDGLIEPRGPVVVVISGRNIDIDQHLRVLNGADA